MNIYRELGIQTKEANQRIIYFGEANTPEEMEGIFRLRYKVYSKRKYIDPARHPNEMEKDGYDDQGVCKYFIAKLDNKIIGCIRLIIESPLPTEKYFTFSEPEIMKTIASSQRCELGRFIIIAPNSDDKDYLPRGLVMLFLLDSLASYGIKHSLLGGYSFIKTSLDKKFKKLKIPVGDITPYVQNYPTDGVLYNYFTQENDPVVPIYFLTSDFAKYADKHIHNSWMFKRTGDTVFTLKSNMYTGFLKALKII